MIFGPNSVGAARYASFIWLKSPTYCDVQLAEMNFKHTLALQRYVKNREVSQQTSRYILSRYSMGDIFCNSWEN